MLHITCNLRYKIPNEIPVASQNWSNYDKHFSLKGLVEEFKGQFGCPGKAMEKWSTFSVRIKKA